MTRDKAMEMIFHRLSGELNILFMSELNCLTFISEEVSSKQIWITQLREEEREKNEGAKVIDTRMYLCIFICRKIGRWVRMKIVICVCRWVNT